MRGAIPVLLVAILGSPGVSAQTSQSSTRTADPPAEAPAAQVDASKLGVSLSRIKRELAQAEAAATAPEDGRLKFSFTVEVVGSAPKINVLEGFPVSGAVPYGSPTHQEVLDVLTPQEFRSPAIPFSALAVWAAKALAEKSKKTRCEEELAAYKALVMQGVAVAAPRCTQ
jgi:hypothetical protein